MRLIIVKYPQKCGKCDELIGADTEAWYAPSVKMVFHKECTDPDDWEFGEDPEPENENG